MNVPQRGERKGERRNSEREDKTSTPSLGLERGLRIRNMAI